MAQKQTLTASPTALAGTTAGTTYTLQCQSPVRMYVQVATAAPTNAEQAFQVAGMGYATSEHESGESIYVWQDDATHYGNVVFDESA